MFPTILMMTVMALIVACGVACFDRWQERRLSVRGARALAARQPVTRRVATARPTARRSAVATEHRRAA